MENDVRKCLELKSSSAVPAIVKGDVQVSYTQLLRLLDFGMTVYDIFGKDRVERSREIKELYDRLNELNGG